MKKKIFTKDNLIFFLILNLGLIFTAVGISIFKTPNHFAFGGTSGLSIILSTLFPKWNVGAFMWIVNAALVVLGKTRLVPSAKDQLPRSASEIILFSRA